MVSQHPDDDGGGYGDHNNDAGNHVCQGEATDLLFMKGSGRNSSTINMKMGTVLNGNSDMRWLWQTMDKKGKEKSAKGDFFTDLDPIAQTIPRERSVFGMRNKNVTSIP